MGSRAAGDRWEAVATVAELGERQIHCVFVAGHPIVLVALDGVVPAVDGWCPHRAAWLWEAGCRATPSAARSTASATICGPARRRGRGAGIQWPPTRLAW